MIKITNGENQPRKPKTKKGRPRLCPCGCGRRSGGHGDYYSIECCLKHNRKREARIKYKKRHDSSFGVDAQKYSVLSSKFGAMWKK